MGSTTEVAHKPYRVHRCKPLIRHQRIPESFTAHNQMFSGNNEPTNRDRNGTTEYPSPARDNGCHGTRPGMQISRKPQLREASAAAGHSCSTKETVWEPSGGSQSLTSLL